MKIIANGIVVRTPSEVAEYVGVRSETVLAWLRSGQIEGIKICGRYFIPEDVMQGLLKKTNQ